MKKYIAFYFLLFLGSLTSCSDECKTFSNEVPETLTPNLQNKLAGVIENSRWTLVSTQGDTIIIEALEPYREIVKQIQYGNGTECSKLFEAERSFLLSTNADTNLAPNLITSFELNMLILTSSRNIFNVQIPTLSDTSSKLTFPWSYTKDESIPANFFSFSDTLRLNDSLYTDVFYLSGTNPNDTTNGFTLYNASAGIIAINTNVDFETKRLHTLVEVK